MDISSADCPALTLLSLTIDIKPQLGGCHALVRDATAPLIRQLAEELVAPWREHLESSGRIATLKGCDVRVSTMKILDPTFLHPEIVECIGIPPAVGEPPTVAMLGPGKSERVMDHHHALKLAKAATATMPRD